MSFPPYYRQNAMAYPYPMQSAGYTQELRPSGSSYMMQRDDGSMTSPFGQHSHCHPKFNPQKLGTTLTVNPGVALKPPKAPEKPVTPYMRYSRKVRGRLKAVNQELKYLEISIVIGQMWKDLPDGEKQHYADEYQVEKAEYDQSHKAYLASPAYQAYMTAKSKASSTIYDMRASSMIGKGYVGALSDRCFEIKPAEDEEDIDDGMSVKHVAHARYMRNHRLVRDIFSDVVVPDIRSVVTTSRMTVLKRQVLSLTVHQKRLETELQQIDEKFESKKRKFMESVPDFQDELMRTHRKPIDEGLSQLMVSRQISSRKREKGKESDELSSLKREKQLLL